MSAYRLAPQAQGASHRVEHFSCMDCLPPPAKRDGLQLDPEKQRRRLCVLPGYDTSTWPKGQPCKRVWMGRGRDYARESKGGDWAAPHEPIADTGCPGAWYRTAFMRSLDPYYRRRTEGGGRIENPAFSRCDDPLVIEAIQTLEAYEDAAQGEERLRQYAAQAERTRAKAGRP